MKQKIMNPNNEIELMAQESSCEDGSSCTAEEIDALTRYWLSYPFVPMMDLILAFDELRKMVKSWLSNKRKHANYL